MLIITEKLSSSILPGWYIMSKHRLDYLLTRIKIHQKLAVSPNENLRLEIETMTTYVVFLFVLQ